ncbi:Premnaspirodiene oxygenase [Heracleum sosnowskyi]|uniref:Premnaspirodiene oxygenase n=1 Tax=Heracleum sosnowskyi TaxID=360622 RepID=A0AAD8H987_9APIA|nr:Premnaspirodiene oxygenase [Heracleum sosnowskyi]
MFLSLQLLSLSMLFVVPLLVFTVLKQLRRSEFHRSNHKLPPGPWKLPIIGSLHHLIGWSNLFHVKFADLALKYEMPIMHLHLGKLSFVVISSPEIAEEVLRTNEVNFAQRFQLIDAESHPYPDCSLIFAPYNDYYKHIRRISVTDLFNNKRVLSLKSLREEEVGILVDSICIQASSSIPFNLSESFCLFINNIVTRSVLGNKSDYLEEFKSCLADVISSTKSFGVDDLFPFLKLLRLVNGKKRRMKKVFKRMDNVLSVIIDEHITKKTVLGTIWDDKPKHEDLLDVLLGIQGSGQAALTHDHIKNLILDIFAAGSMAVRSILEWAMAEMLRNPRIMKKAQAEVRNAVLGKIKLKEEDTQNLPYLNSIIKETMRLHISTPLLPRESRKTCKINGFLIPEKTKIVVNIWAMSRDPKYWSDPECFEPERFTVSSTNGMEYIPFGAGRRKCPGGYFGLTSIELALAQLLCHFDWKLPQGVKPEDLDMNEISEITTRRKKDLYVVAVHV